jgi:hypothetical protein
MKASMAKVLVATAALFFLWLLLRHFPEAGSAIRNFLEKIERAGAWGCLIYGLAGAVPVEFLLHG